MTIKIMLFYVRFMTVHGHLIAFFVGLPVCSLEICFR
jgi:hypothetical protein